MRILVTGANGLLGQKIILQLHDTPDVEVIATARRPAAIKLANSEYHTMDITDRQHVENVLRMTMPDVVIHTAAMTQVDDCELQREDCWKTNVEAVSHIVDACKALNVHLIHLSTDFVFDGENGPLDEEAKPNPVNYYGESKLAAENLIQQSGISWTIIRTVLVYGVNSDMSRSNIVLWVKNNLEQNKTIHVVNDQWRTPTLAEDLARGCCLAALKKARGIYNISGKDFLSPYDIAIKTAEFFKLDKSLIKPTDSARFTQPAKRPPRTGFIIEKARKELGYEPHSFEEGLSILARQIGHVTLDAGG